MSVSAIKRNNFLAVMPMVMDFLTNEDVENLRKASSIFREYVFQTLCARELQITRKPIGQSWRQLYWDVNSLRIRERARQSYLASYNIGRANADRVRDIALFAIPILSILKAYYFIYPEQMNNCSINDSSFSSTLLITISYSILSNTISRNASTKIILLSNLILCSSLSIFSDYLVYNIKNYQCPENASTTYIVPHVAIAAISSMAFTIGLRHINISGRSILTHYVEFVTRIFASEEMRTTIGIIRGSISGVISLAQGYFDLLNKVFG